MSGKQYFSSDITVHVYTYLRISFIRMHKLSVFPSLHSVGRWIYSWLEKIYCTENDFSTTTKQLSVLVLN